MEPLVPSDMVLCLDPERGKEGHPTHSPGTNENTIVTVDGPPGLILQTKTAPGGPSKPLHAGMNQTAPSILPAKKRKTHLGDVTWHRFLERKAVTWRSLHQASGSVGGLRVVINDLISRQP